ncbi:hypothetical protein PoB_004603700 [Plakobranchus ocellatus]|uniref:Uncharacterized protein n=1 Tax=Plakobranchus ocellatus TaxID=259542 RepID=A0AAV4BKT9_9GAST|nr:hypothetical protein PoB_004603700 [Plakobranchus ocellatus]
MLTMMFGSVGRGCQATGLTSYLRRVTGASTAFQEKCRVKHFSATKIRATPEFCKSAEEALRDVQDGNHLLMGEKEITVSNPLSSKTYHPNIESIDSELVGVLNYYYYADGRGRRLLAYRSCSSPNEVPLQLQRPVINKQKVRGTSWAVIKESTVLSCSSDKRVAHARTSMLSLPKPHRPCRGNPHDVITLRSVFRCAVGGNPLELY